MSQQPNHWPLKPHTLDKWVVGLIGAGGAAMLMGNIVIVCNRTYRPIKFKSVPLTLLSSLGGLIWICAVLVANDHFERKEGTILATCALWTYWFQVCGSALWLNCLTARLFVLCRIFICKSDSPTYYLFLIALLLPAVGFCIAATRSDQLQYALAPTPSSGVEAVADCQFHHNAYMAYGLIALLLIYFLIFLGFAFKLRNAMAQFNEFRLIRRGGILSLFLFLLSLVTIGTHAYYTPVGRCLLSSAVASAIFYYFWARNGDVIYNVLFNQADYLYKFNKDLKRSPSQHERVESNFQVVRLEANLANLFDETNKVSSKGSLTYTEGKEGMSAHVMSFEEGAVLDDSKWQAPAYCFDEENGVGAAKLKERIGIRSKPLRRFISSLEASIRTPYSFIV